MSMSSSNSQSRTSSGVLPKIREDQSQAEESPRGDGRSISTTFKKLFNFSSSSVVTSDNYDLKGLSASTLGSSFGSTRKTSPTHSTAVQRRTQFQSRWEDDQEMNLQNGSSTRFIDNDQKKSH